MSNYKVNFKPVILVLLGILVTHNSYSQTKIHSLLNGRVTASNEDPIESVTILLYKSDSTLYRTAISDKNGEFSVPNVDYGHYSLSVNHVNFNPFTMDIQFDSSTTNISVILDSFDSKQTIEVVIVTAKKQSSEKKLTKLIVNVAESIIASNDNLLDILQKAPSVMITPDNKVAIGGKPGALILIDGRETHLSSGELINMLQNQPSSNIDRLEIIANPPAKYEAAGSAGIINIITKKEKTLGFNSNITSGFSYGETPKYNAGFSGNYRFKRILIFGSYDYSNNKNLYRPDQIRTFNKNTDNQTVFNQKGEILSHSRNNYYKIGADFTIDSNNTIGIILNGYDNRSKGNGINTTNIGRNIANVDSSIIAESYTENSSVNNSYNINYTSILSKNINLSANLDYSKYSGDINSLIDNVFINSSRLPYRISNQLPVNINIKSAKLDLTIPINKYLNVETGLKLSSTSTDNDFIFKSDVESQSNELIVDSARTNHFIYDERINAYYFNGKGTFKKLEYELGLRAEHTISKANSLTSNLVVDRNYLNFFPSISIGYSFLKNGITELSYSKRIDRPLYSDLNPFVIFYNEYSFEQGNPYLKPSISNSLQLSQSVNNKLFLSFSYTRTVDIPSVIYRKAIDSESTIVTTENISSLNNYSFSMSYPIISSKIFNSRLNANIYYNRFATVEPAINPNDKLTFTANSSTQINISRGFNGELNMVYMSPAAYGIIITEPIFSFNIGLRKSIGDNLNIGLSATDIFNTVRTAGRILNQDVNIYIHQKPETRQIKLSLAYKLGRKTVKISEPKGTGVEDEKRRVKIGN